MTPENKRESLNRDIQRTWLALKSIAQKMVHDTNNIYGAIQGYVSLLEMSPGGNEQLEKYLPAMHDALRTGVDRNKAIAAFYRQTELMVINVDPLPTIREEVAGYASDNGYEVTVSATDDLPPLPLDEPIFRQMIVKLCFLAEQTDTETPQFDLSRVDLSEDDIDSLVMEGSAGSYMRLGLRFKAADVNGDATRFLEPFRMSPAPNDDLGLAMVLPGVANHRGNLDLWREGDSFNLSLYFPYPA